ncbi:MAG: hypothetical protein F6K00_26095 [Leptolyngbya sp. SIOISBB]|nr:hypothetical protein [Leptolyngbya sp. SIOISBB]
MPQTQTVLALEVPQYADLKSAIWGTCQAWCQAQGYSDPVCRNGEWWAFPPHSVMPVSIKTVMASDSQQWVKIGPVTLALFPDGSLAKGIPASALAPRSAS